MTTKIPPELVDDQVFGRRNILINGDFGIYQRALQATGVGASAKTKIAAAAVRGSAIGP